MAKKKRGGTGSSVAKGVGAAVVIAFLLGMYTGIPGFGGGDGPSGDGGGTAEGSTPAPGPIDAEDKLTKAGLADDTVTVLIDGYDYSVLTKVDGEEQYQTTSMKQVVSLAKLAKGDESGVRVKVQRRESARMRAEADLKEALKTAGIPANTIYWPNQLLP